jgi:hypothetical protein
MAISRVGPVGEHPRPAPSNGDRRSGARTPIETSVAHSSVEGTASDRVFLSETARVIAGVLSKAASKLRLSPAELRAMMEPAEEDHPLKPKRAGDDSLSNPEDRHAR